LTPTERPSEVVVMEENDRFEVCLDCYESFEVGVAACPACGSEVWTSLARFLNPRGPRAGPSRSDPAA
jgi:uncharacterized protein (UPF0212 family)